MYALNFLCKFVIDCILGTFADCCICEYVHALGFLCKFMID